MSNPFLIVNRGTCATANITFAFVADTTTNGFGFLVVMARHNIAAGTELLYPY